MNLIHPKKTRFFSTQISGKYSDKNLGLFRFKNELKSRNIDVKYPVGDRIVAYSKDGIGLTFDPVSNIQNFYTLEISFFEAIENCTFHTLYNLLDNQPYIGESSLVETLFAMLNSKPIILASKEIDFGQNIGMELKNIFLHNMNDFFIYSSKSNFPYKSVKYNIPFQDKLHIYNFISSLFSYYKAIL